MAQIRHLVDPKTVRAKLKNATFRFFFDQRQSERVAVERDGLVVSVARAFDGDIGAAGKLRALQFGDHDRILDLRFGIANLQLATGGARETVRVYRGFSARRS